MSSGALAGPQNSASIGEFGRLSLSYSAKVTPRPRTKVGIHKAMDVQREVLAEAAHRPRLTVQVVSLDQPRTR
jgi:hypothetical protein